MAGFGIGDAHPGQWVEDIVRTLEKLHNNSEEVLQALKDAVTACTEWGRALSELFEPDTMEVLINVSGCRQALQKGKAIISCVRLPGGGDHMFAIDPLGDGLARVLHAWPNKHPLRTETPMTIDAVSDLMEQLPELDCGEQSDLVKLRENLRLLWGPDYTNEFADMATSATQRISFYYIHSGVPQNPMEQLEDALGRLKEHSTRATVFTYEERAAPSNDQHKLPISVRQAASFGQSVGLVFGAGVWNEEVDPNKIVVGRIIEAQSTSFEGVDWFSMFRANAAAGAVMTRSVFPIWDVEEWKLFDNKARELHECLRDAAVGFATGAGVGLIFGPLGAVAGGIVGGLVGYIRGGFGGKAIWDRSEDSVINSYKIFGWDSVARNTRPIKSAEDMGNAYAQALEKKPEKMKQDLWAEACVAYMMVLLPAMYPEFTVLMQLANKLREMKSEGLSVAAMSMYDNILKNIE